MKTTSRLRSFAILSCALCGALAAYGFQSDARDASANRALGRRAPFDPIIEQNAARMMEEGRRTFRYDTFGDEAFWGGLLRLHEAIAGEHFGGVGPGVSPRTALLVGLKVDSDALPKSVLRAIKRVTSTSTTRPSRWSCCARTPWSGSKGSSRALGSPRWASSARSVIRPWITRSRRESVVGSTGGQPATSTSAPSWRSPPTSGPSPTSWAWTKPRCERF